MLEPWLKEWYFCVVDLVGQFGGLILGWSPRCKSLSSTLFNSVMEVKLKLKDIRITLLVLNIYGPYSNRIPYWQNVP